MRWSSCIAVALIVLGAAGAEAAFDPFSLTPGGDVRAALELMPDGAGGWRGRQFIATIAAIPGILEQQRVIVTADATGTRIVAVHVQVIARRGATTRELLALYEDVRRRLVERFGSPEWEVRDDAGAEPVMTSQWPRSGDRPLMRAGIPRRLDGRAVVEVVVTGRSIPRTEMFWGADEFAD